MPAGRTAARSGRPAHPATQRHPPRRIPQRRRIRPRDRCLLELRPHLAVVTGDLISAHGDPLDACIRQMARFKRRRRNLRLHGQSRALCQGRRLHRSGRRARRHPRSCGRPAQPLRFGNAALNLAGVDYQRWRAARHYLRGAERLIVPGAMQRSALPQSRRISGGGRGRAIICCLRVIRMADRSRSRFWTSPSTRRASSRPTFMASTVRCDAAAYVTRGIGTIGIPARIGAPPEISAVAAQKGLSSLHRALSDTQRPSRQLGGPGRRPARRRRPLRPSALLRRPGRLRRRPQPGRRLGARQLQRRACAAITTSACTGLDDLEWFNPVAAGRAVWTQDEPDARKMPSGPATLPQGPLSCWTASRWCTARRTTRTST